MKVQLEFPILQRRHFGITDMSQSSPKPSPEHFVKSLMKFIRATSEPDSGNEKIFYLCPKPGCGREIKFISKSSFTNPYRHLLSCYGKGKRPAEQISVVLNLYQKAVEEQRRVGRTISSHFDATALSAVDKALYSYIRLINIRSMPISIVECPEFRSFSRQNVHIKRATIIEVIFFLVELVEERISVELSRTKRAVMYDGWSETGTHSVGLYACYCAPQTIRSNMADRVEEVTR